MPFHSIDDYHTACRKQIAVDNTHGVECVYLPNTVFTEKPKYCLIGTEPSCGGFGVGGMRALVDQGMTNFLYSHGDFIIQLCAFEYLCNNRFDFILTDLSKGAMPVANAAQGRQGRYVDWFPILQNEIEFYRDPVRIGVAKDVEDFFKRNGLAIASRVLHYSKRNGIRFRTYYAEHPQDQRLTYDLDEKLKNFMKLLFETINYPQKLRTDRLNALGQREINVDYRGMYLYYRDKFLGLSNIN